MGVHLVTKPGEVYTFGPCIGNHWEDHFTSEKAVFMLPIRFGCFQSAFFPLGASAYNAAVTGGRPRSVFVYMHPLMYLVILSGTYYLLAGASRDSAQSAYWVAYYLPDIWYVLTYGDRSIQKNIPIWQYIWRCVYMYSYSVLVLHCASTVQYTRSIEPRRRLGLAGACLAGGWSEEL